MLKRCFGWLVLAPVAVAWAEIGFGTGWRVGEPAPVPAHLGGVLAGVVLSMALWRAVRYLDTLWHEIGHGTVATVFGGRIRRITIHTDGSGIAAYQTPPGWGRWKRLTTAAAGYPFPAAVAVAAAVYLRAGAAMWVVWYFAVVTAAAAVLLVRNVWGLVVSAVFAALCHLIATTGGPGVVDVAVSVLVGLMAAGSIRSSVEQWRLAGVDDSDAATISSLTGLPARVAAAVQVASCCAAGLVAGWWLTTPWR